MIGGGPAGGLWLRLWAEIRIEADKHFLVTSLDIERENKVDHTQEELDKMTKDWYPIINFENCIECGACMNKCSHGVYQKDSEKPVVIYPEGCIDRCTGCQALCPAEAIQYYGDTGGPKTTCTCGSC